MNKKSVIAVVGALILAGASYILKEDVKGALCAAPAAAEAK